jgi:hypothetical protein
MDRFVRKDIPSMSNERLIAERAYNRKMMSVALDQARANAIKKNKSYTYYHTNQVLIANELLRRHTEREGIWTTGVDGVMTVEDAKQKLRIDIVEKKKSIRGLSEADANAIMVNWNESLKYLEGQLQAILEIYPDEL